MIFGLHPLFGFLPLLLYIVLMMMGKDMNVSVLLCVILGAILTGESITGFADTLYASLGSFCALIGFIIVLGSGLAEVLSQTKVAHNLVYMVVNRFKLKSKKMAILISMITSTLLVSLLGTLAGSNAIIAPILIPIVASVGLTPSTLGVILHGAGATGLYVGPFVPPVVTITGLTGLSYGQYLITAGIPLAVIVWGSTFFMACRTQRKTEALEAYEESGEDASAFVPDARCKRATLAFLLVMAVMLGYGLVVGAGASYAILVMMTASIVVGSGGRPVLPVLPHGYDSGRLQNVLDVLHVRPVRALPQLCQRLRRLRCGLPAHAAPDRCGRRGRLPHAQRRSGHLWHLRHRRGSGADHPRAVPPHGTVPQYRHAYLGHGGPGGLPGHLLRHPHR